jgi:hypothetical protein
MEAAAPFAAYCNGNYSMQASSGCWYGKLFRIPKWLMHVFAAGRKRRIFSGVISVLR